MNNSYICGTFNTKKIIEMYLKNRTTARVKDQETGQYKVVELEKKYSIKTTADEFYMTFLSSIQNMEGMSGTDLKVLSHLCSIAEYNTGVVYLPPERKREIVNLIKVGENRSMSMQTFSNSLTSLKKRDFISGRGGVFTINPKYHWKGETKVRDQILNGQLEITFAISDKIDSFLKEGRKNKIK